MSILIMIIIPNYMAIFIIIIPYYMSIFIIFIIGLYYDYYTEQYALYFNVNLFYILHDISIYIIF